MINVLVALKMWGQHWRGKYVKILVDNEAVVSVCQSHYTRDPLLAKIARNIWLITSIQDIKLSVVHIAGRDNVVADLLSRWNDSKEQHEKLKNLVSNYTWEEIPQDIFYLEDNI